MNIYECSRKRKQPEAAAIWKHTNKKTIGREDIYRLAPIRVTSEIGV